MNYFDSPDKTQSVSAVYKPEHPWVCITCRSGYAEYVNGCPHCWEAGEIRSKVVMKEDLEKFTR